jgi:CysZ protein
LKKTPATAKPEHAGKGDLQMKVIRDFRSGFYYSFHGLRFLFQNGSLIKLAFIPWIINILLFIAVVTVLYHYFPDLISLIVTKPESWYGLIPYYLFATILLLIAIIISGFFVFFIGNLIASPFHEWMTEKTKALLGKEAPSSEPFSFGLLWKEAKRIVITQGKKLLLILILEILVLLLVLIPAIGPFLSGSLTLFLIAFQFLGFPLEVERLSFSDQMAHFFKHPFAWFGFGAGLSLMLAIPIINLSVLPGGVVGASLLYYQKTD